MAFTDRPNSTGRPLVRRALFHIYYVYAATPEYLLLGTEPRVNHVGRCKELIVGWVPRQRVCEWDTREAIEFNKKDLANKRRTKLCRIFGDPDKLKAYLDGHKSEHIAEEENNSQEWAYYQSRFPVIDGENYHQEPYGDNHIYRVGIIGDVFQVDAKTQSSQVVLRAAEVAALREKIAELKQRTDKIQICFFIDATFSMEACFDEARKAVRLIITEIQSRASEPKLEISINFYRDRADGRLSREFNPFLPIRNAAEVLEKARPIGGKYRYEMVFAAICERLEDKRKDYAFDPDAIKIVVLIGDDGNAPNENVYTLDRVYGRIIKAGGSWPIGFLAIPVGKERSESRKLFTSQAKAIAAKLTAHEIESLRKHGQKGRDGSELKEFGKQHEESVRKLTGQVSEDPEKVAESIFERFKVALQEMDYLRARLNDLQSGSQPLRAGVSLPGSQDSESIGRFGVVWQQRVNRLIEDKGFTPLQLQEDATQLFTEGWISKFDPNETAPAEGSRPQQIRHVMLIHKSKLRKYLVLLDLVLQRWNPKAMHRTWKEAIDQLFGGDVSSQEGLTVLELIEMHVGVKVKEGLLGYKPTELQKLPPSELVRLRRTLENKRARMNDVLEEREAEWYWSSEGLRFKNRRPRKYWWSDDRDQGEPRAWAPRDVLP